MPAVTSGRVLVTGANGYIAVWVVRYLLERGFSVRGSVRSKSKGTYLSNCFKSYGDKFEIAVVDDITQDDAFDAATEGVDAILHIASPVILEAGEPDEVILPAVKGTESILKSALKHRATVKRVIITSSTASVITPPLVDAEPRVFDERDWNEYSLEHVRERGRAANGLDKYCASKVLAERAGWDFYARAKAEVATSEGGGELGWDLVTLMMPFVFGPAIHEAPTLDKFNGTARTWYDHVVRGDLWGAPATTNVYDGRIALIGNDPSHGYEFVDVRDFAEGEVLSLITPTAGDERFIISGPTYTWQEFTEAARRYSDKIPAIDTPYTDVSSLKYPVRYSCEKAQRILGVKSRSLEETTKDSVEDFKARGWL
ncbi:NAD-P-binding protein [Trametes meyenii]|nr:NAD-P-binding protein [Trametes meyenii]